ncbi:hypothetical protein JQX13_18565 [Archangium violaceum]|uniref:hypothetical protein n=1 Tax=Archangium violaceum TaxID=83451 RepID=UPI00193C3D84|nr:hypothetical protein [Archangium violaceum]QRK11879.1 hypothetical protein JQX13_18565 [Archangium violaceum]
MGGHGARRGGATLGDGRLPDDAHEAAPDGGGGVGAGLRAQGMGRAGGSGHGAAARGRADDRAGLKSIRENIPLPPPDGGTWVVGGNSTPDVQGVLRQVRRVELLVQPAGAGSFTADFHPDFGLP